MSKHNPYDPAMFTLDGRLASFKQARWPQFTRKDQKRRYKISPETMAAAGFFARPIDGSVDNACCGYCHKNLDGWCEQDVAWEEHVGHSAGCPLVSLGEQVNRELSFTLARWPHTGTIDPSKVPGFMSIAIFTDGSRWPRRASFTGPSWTTGRTTQPSACNAAWPSTAGSPMMTHGKRPLCNGPFTYVRD